MEAFIEKQFPVSKISKESYKERKAVQGQTLTGLGKWWGRKPLVLVRAAILGCLLPATNNPQRDLDIFLKIMSMDASGLALRREKPLTVAEMHEFASRNQELRGRIHEWFVEEGGKWKLRSGVDKQQLEQMIYKTLGYDEKISRSIRPEQLKNLDPHTWAEINHHLGTTATTLQQLVEQLSLKRFGRQVIVGDCFSGGGSIPFEASRMGCETYASDLNPIAALLTWASIHINGASEAELAAIHTFREEVFAQVDQEITALGIEHNEFGDRALSYLYCVEANCPECGVVVPLSPSWVIGKRTNTIAQLQQVGKNFDLTIKMGVSPREMKEAERTATLQEKGLVCPACGKSTPITSLRRDRKDENGNVNYGLRQWDKNDFDFRDEDIYRERLYAIKYERNNGDRYYRHPNERDLANEQKVKSIVAEHLVFWQQQGLVPSMEIESGHNTDQLIRERGWTHWHHLFNARQLLIISSLARDLLKYNNNIFKVAGILGLNRCIDWNSRLCHWHSGAGAEKSERTYYNQALNTFISYGTRSFLGLKPSWYYTINPYHTNRTNTTVQLIDARNVSHHCHLWITDPPYADAVNYHELSELFLAWDKKLLQQAFPEWYTDSKRILAVKGDKHFAQQMIDIYTNLTKHMHDDGMQIVMFTHSDPAVWAQLALIMWKSGLRVTAAWNIATETDSGGLKEGNYVKGTVLLVLRKQKSHETAYLDEIHGDIKAEVLAQIESMQALDNQEEPNFSDPDYVLAAYAASLKVLTSYQRIGELNLDAELNIAINDPKRSEIVKIIEQAKKTAFNSLIPVGFDAYHWKSLSPAERFYMKGLEAEKHNNYQISTYQEYARGFSIISYNQLMANERANTARLKTASEFAMRTMHDIPDFEQSLLRTVLAAIHIAVKEDGVPDKGLHHLKNQVADYWGHRDLIKTLLLYLKDSKGIANMPHWSEDAEMADQIYILVDHDHI
jgi:putative DNA methylase